MRATERVAGPFVDEVRAETPKLRVAEIAPVCEADPYPRYPAGKYEAQCVSAQIYRDPHFRAWKALLRFRTATTGELVCGFFHMGRGDEPKAGRRSRYYRAWTIANNGPPRRRQTLSARVFKGKVFEVEIADVAQSFDQRAHPKSLVYSTVREILSKKWP